MRSQAYKKSINTNSYSSLPHNNSISAAVAAGRASINANEDSIAQVNTFDYRDVEDMEGT